MDANNSWDWNEEAFGLDADSPLAISQSLWDEWTQSETDAQNLFTSTPPSSEVADPIVPITSFSNTQVKIEVTENQDSRPKESPRCKRRRVLLFAGDKSEDGISAYDLNEQLTTLNGCESSMLGGYKNMQVSDSEIAAAFWFSANEEPLCSANEAPENWMLGCIDDREGFNSVVHEQLDALVPLYPTPEKEATLPDVPSSSTAATPPVSISQIKPKLATPVAYPFSVVKPSGVEGNVTLNDINQRILMPPTRPIQHPVGDHAKPPSISSTGSGLSGKAVVALTKIQTEGKGTITIMRTKG